MSKLDDYKTAHDEHNTMIGMLSTMPDDPNVRGTTSWGPNTHTVLFFSPNGVSRRLAQFLALSCKSLFMEITRKAISLSEEDVNGKAQAAQDEAIETLKIIHIETGENHETQKTANP